ncbi:hypothetical protein [Actinomycetospora termitidis]|uniref:Tetratricopeptide repeat protein n=1 Tax=Actinomycetospora termitidis TaxID=3053470 RepID=A0ABT7M4W7_9PSEU|nr:hypothetical protein [Actinomycetospora sp. Odt1-22]MDL5155724.1 hypothetical protein [Actinomycetospora sp. Odt1-22]
MTTTSRRRALHDPAATEPLPRLREVDLVALGVHRPLPAPPAGREADHRIETAVGGDVPVVVVAAPRLSGATLALARAARLLLGDHRVVRPDPASLAGSAPLSGPADPGLLDALADHPDDGSVIWLDGVGPALLAALLVARPPAGVRILATVDEALLHPDVTPVQPGAGVTLLRLSDGLPGGPAVDLSAARGLLLGRGGTTPRFGLPGRRVPAPARAAVLRAAVDWSRLGVPHALPTPLLARLALAYARAMPDTTTTPGVEDLTRAVEELVAPGGKGRPAPPLRRLRLPEGVHHVPDPLLTAAADRLGREGWEPPDRLREVVGDLLGTAADRADRRTVGVLAVTRGFDDLAAALLRPPTAPDAPRALEPTETYRLGIASLQAGRAAEGRRWFAAVLAATPDDGSRRELRARAAFWLGLDRDADPADRRGHLELVVRDGPPRDASDAALLLAGLERDAGRFDAQRGCLRAAVAAARTAADVGRQAEATLDLAHLDRHSGRLAEARAGYERVGELVDPDEPAGLTAARALAELDAGDGSEDAEKSEDTDDEPPAGFVPDPLPEQRAGSDGPPLPRDGGTGGSGGSAGPAERPTVPPRTPSSPG